MIDSIKSIDSTALAPVLKYHLIPQTPIIHFQYAESGATLRATEVKPKLDKFLRKRAEEDGKVLPKNFFIKETKALNYKLHLVEEERIGTYDIGPRTPYDIYYGNQGVDDESKKKKAVESKILMTITCNNHDLRSLIDKYIGEFFIVTNFGSMSGKGFGSFCVKEKKFSESQIATALKRETSSYNCYAFYGGTNPFKLIKTIYTIMKSGMSVPESHDSSLFNYFEYENRVAIYDEKEGLRVEGLVPLHPKKEVQSKDKYFYLRALLGVGDRATYKLRSSNGSFIEFTITMVEESKTIKRLASPIFFKVIGSKVYIVANRINPEIYKKVFIFKKDKLGPSCKFPVPDEDMLNDQFIDDFLWCAIDYINANSSKSRLLHGTIIEEVK